VLTAAHCVVADKGVADAAAIFAGNVDRTKGDWIDVQRILPHEQYDPATALNDVAVLRLATDYGDGRWIAIADDETDEKLASPGQTATIAGWGAMWDPRLLSDLLSNEEQSRVTEPVTLRDAEVKIVDRGLCQTRYQEAVEAAEAQGSSYQGGSYRVTENHICAGETGKGVCVGDSGGPLMVKAPNPSGYIQIGIASWVRVCGEPGFPGVFTRVSRYRDWIANKVR
jgi:secreted trypsin-like serine protease